MVINVWSLRSELERHWLRTTGARIACHAFRCVLRLQTGNTILFNTSIVPEIRYPTPKSTDCHWSAAVVLPDQCQGRIQDLIRGGAPDRDRPKIAILGPQFCRILVLGPHFWWSGGGPGPLGPPPLDLPLNVNQCKPESVFHRASAWHCL